MTGPHRPGPDDAGPDGPGADGPIEDGLGAAHPAGEPEPAEPQQVLAEPRTVARPYDPERGLRAVMSGLLILEAITVLLAIPVAEKTGADAGPVGVTLICLLALAHIGACAVVARPFAVPVIVVLQVLMIASWLITGPLGVIGVVFALVWGVIFYFRAEFRRRQAAGTLPSQQIENQQS